jgi:DNA-binding CsgD family transcriptional regulator
MLVRQGADIALVGEKLLSLSPRERQVLAYAIKGEIGKQTAYQLGIAEITVKAHRSRIFVKMGCRNMDEVMYLLFQWLAGTERVTAFLNALTEDPLLEFAHPPSPDDHWSG